MLNSFLRVALCHSIYHFIVTSLHEVQKYFFHINRELKDGMDRSLIILDNAISENIHSTRTFPGWQQHTVEALIEHTEWKGNFCHSSYNLSVAYNKLTN